MLIKKILCLFFVLLLVCGCSGNCDITKKNPQSTNNERLCGVWISYSEIENMCQKGFALEFDNAIDNCVKLGVTDLFVHIRAFCDSIYDSKIFPQTESSQKCEMDILDYMINSCHEKNIKFHAWINPYRVRTADCNIDKLPKKSPVYRWLKDSDSENDKNVCICDGIYLNPASLAARELIIDGIREVLDNYPLDGIHFDDYFYPTSKSSFDEQSYSDYCSSCSSPLCLEEWRRTNVSALISSCKSAVKYKGSNIIFSISPAADIKKNYDEYFADIISFAESGYVDMLIPQLYFGFEYPIKKFRFENILSEWEKALSNSDCRLCIGLAAYKTGTSASPDTKEWKTADDIVAKQVGICLKDSKISGYVFFSYSSLFSSKSLNKKAFEKILNRKNNL